MGGIYVHIPFCASKCPYCDFYSCRKDAGERGQYVAALLDEIQTGRRAAAYVKEPFMADTLYLGGGTPSVLTGAELYSLVTAAKESYHLPENAEITVECNPASDLEAVIPALGEAGVNRISLGLQSAVDSERRSLGRRATAARVREVIDLIRKNGIENISLDLMLGIPGQTQETLKTSLDFVREEAVPHVSAYLLQLETGTVFFRRQKELGLPDENETCALYETAAEALSEMGLARYEISNFARPGFESRHNLKYWLLEDYLGIGAAAHSLVNGKRFYYSPDMQRFLAGEKPDFEDDGDTEEEYIMLRLRLASGISLADFSARYGKADCDLLQKKSLPLKEQGLIQQTEEQIALTNKGILLSNRVIAELIP